LLFAVDSRDGAKSNARRGERTPTAGVEHFPQLLFCLIASLALTKSSAHYRRLMRENFPA
jgi:hypothetical protein